MSREDDVSLILRAYELWKAGDVEELLGLCDDEIAWVPPASMPEPQTRRGKEALRAGITSYFEIFEEFWPEPEEILDTDQPDTYLVLVRTHTRGRGSGAEVTIEVAHAVTIREGHLARFQVFVERGEALAAHGLDQGKA